MKKLGKWFVVLILGWQVRRLRKRTKIIVVAVAGSIGKTSTKNAIASVLSQKRRVLFQEGNYNDLVSVPLIFFGKSLPSLANPFAWISLFMANESQIRQPYPYDIVVVELGTDGPGQLKKFGKYLHANFGVLTAIAPEHMEYFKDMEAVAREETEIGNLADMLVVNGDLCSLEYQQLLPQHQVVYATTAEADYKIANISQTPEGMAFDLTHNDSVLLHATGNVVSKTQLYSLAAAATVAHMLGLGAADIIAGIQATHAVSGRMQRMRGIHNAVIIDDTYNASPDAMIAALQAVYDYQAPQKIAVLGNMNELGDHSQEAHERVGSFCDPAQLKWVITIGQDANQYLAAAAEAKGCTVQRCSSPYEVGPLLQGKIEEGALILLKGSQNGVFAEEAVKALLADQTDADKLVRQSPEWLAKKKRMFHA